MKHAIATWKQDLIKGISLPISVGRKKMLDPESMQYYSSCLVRSMNTLIGLTSNIADRDTTDDWKLNYVAVWREKMWRPSIINCEEFWLHKMFDGILDDMVEAMWRLTKNQEGQSLLWGDAYRTLSWLCPCSSISLKRQFASSSFPHSTYASIMELYTIFPGVDHELEICLMLFPFVYVFHKIWIERQGNIHRGWNKVQQFHSKETQLYLSHLWYEVIKY